MPSGFPGALLSANAAPAHPVHLPALFFHKLSGAATAVPGSKGPQTKLRSTRVWFMVAGAALGEGEWAGAATGNNKQLSPALGWE